MSDHQADIAKFLAASTPSSFSTNHTQIVRNVENYDYSAVEVITNQDEPWAHGGNYIIFRPSGVGSEVYFPTEPNNNTMSNAHWREFMKVQRHPFFKSYVDTSLTDFFLTLTEFSASRPVQKNPTTREISLENIPLDMHGTAHKNYSIESMESFFNNSENASRMMMDLRAYMAFAEPFFTDATTYIERYKAAGRQFSLNWPIRRWENIDEFWEDISGLPIFTLARQMFDDNKAIQEELKRVADKADDTQRAEYNKELAAASKPSPAKAGVFRAVTGALTGGIKRQMVRFGQRLRQMSDAKFKNFVMTLDDLDYNDVVFYKDYIMTSGKWNGVPSKNMSWDDWGRKPNEGNPEARPEYPYFEKDDGTKVYCSHWCPSKIGIWMTNRTDITADFMMWTVVPVTGLCRHYRMLNSHQRTNVKSLKIRKLFGVQRRTAMRHPNTEKPHIFNDWRAFGTIESLNPVEDRNHYVQAFVFSEYVIKKAREYGCVGQPWKLAYELDDIKKIILATPDDIIMPVGAFYKDVPEELKMVQWNDKRTFEEYGSIVTGLGRPDEMNGRALHHWEIVEGNSDDKNQTLWHTMRYGCGKDFTTYCDQFISSTTTGPNLKARVHTNDDDSAADGIFKLAAEKSKSDIPVASINTVGMGIVLRGEINNPANYVYSVYPTAGINKEDFFKHHVNGYNPNFIIGVKLRDIVWYRLFNVTKRDYPDYVYVGQELVPPTLWRSFANGVGLGEIACYGDRGSLESTQCSISTRVDGVESYRYVIRDGPLEVDVGYDDGGGRRQERVFTRHSSIIKDDKGRYRFPCKSAIVSISRVRHCHNVGIMFVDRRSNNSVGIVRHGKRAIVVGPELQMKSFNISNEVTIIGRRKWDKALREVMKIMKLGAPVDWEVTYFGPASVKTDADEFDDEVTYFAPDHVPTDGDEFDDASEDDAPDEFYEADEFYKGLEDEDKTISQFEFMVNKTEGERHRHNMLGFTEKITCTGEFDGEEDTGFLQQYADPELNDALGRLGIPKELLQENTEELIPESNRRCWQCYACEGEEKASKYLDLVLRGRLVN